MLTNEELIELASLLSTEKEELKTKLLNIPSYLKLNVITEEQANILIGQANEAISQVLFPTVIPDPDPVVYNRITITDSKIVELEKEYKVEIEFNPKTNKYDVFKNAEKVNVGDNSNPVYKIVGTHVLEFESSVDLELELIPYLKNI